VTVFLRIVDPSVAFDTPLEDVAAVELVRALTFAFFGRAFTGPATKRKRTIERHRYHILFTSGIIITASVDRRKQSI